MFEDIAYYMIFGKPLGAYLGIIALLSLLTTASIAILNRKGIASISMEWHFRLAYITLFFSLLHGLLMLFSSFLK